jgi:hypothetical protein
MKATDDFVALYKSHANFMKHSPSGEANRYSVTQIPHFFNNEVLSVH